MTFFLTFYDLSAIIHSFIHFSFHFQSSKAKLGPVSKPPSLTSNTSSTQISKAAYASGVSTVNQLIPLRSSSTIKLAGAFPTPLPRATAPRLVAAGK